MSSMSIRNIFHYILESRELSLAFEGKRGEEFYGPYGNTLRMICVGNPQDPWSIPANL